jgi:hypothetical protein
VRVLKPLRYPTIKSRLEALNMPYHCTPHVFYCLLCAVNFIKMALKTKEELEAKVRELKQDERKFTDFLRDTYGDKQCSHKIEIHTWRIRREIEIIEWVLNSELPF